MRSASVDLPWSMWAMIEKLRMWAWSVKASRRTKSRRRAGSVRRVKARRQQLVEQREQSVPPLLDAEPLSTRRRADLGRVQVQRLADAERDRRGSASSSSTPVSPTTSGSAPARVVTGTQRASIASATETPKPSCLDACT